MHQCYSALQLCLPQKIEQSLPKQIALRSVFEFLDNSRKLTRDMVHSMASKPLHVPAAFFTRPKSSPQPSAGQPTRRRPSPVCGAAAQSLAPFPSEYPQAIRQAQSATKQALTDGCKLIEVEFPTASLSSVAGDAEGKVSFFSSLLLCGTSRLTSVALGV
jgi:hypothetical protein